MYKEVDSDVYSRAESDINYPVIWKKESCLRGECSNQHDYHWWSLPFSAAFGLAAECYRCRKLKMITVETSS